MTNGVVALLRKRWSSLMAWVAAMDYSAADYSNDRIGRLEREVEQLKDELRRTRVSAGAADGGWLSSVENRPTNLGAPSCLVRSVLRP